MLISKKNRLAILTYLFKEGVIVAKKDYNLPKHPEVTEVSNLEVIKLCTSLTSRELVSCRFAWKHYYWFLTDEGIECASAPPLAVARATPAGTSRRAGAAAAPHLSLGQ